MATVIPSVVCIGVIGRNNNPLHLTILPSYNPSASTSTTTSPGLKQQKQQQKGHPQISPLRTPLQFSLLLSTTLDIFELRARQHAASGAGALSGDLGLLCAVDERLACYGFETNTGVRFVAVVDVRGRMVDITRTAPPVAPASSGEGTGTAAAATGAAGTGSGTAAPRNNSIPTSTGNTLTIPYSLPPLSGIGLLSSSSTTTTAPNNPATGASSASAAKIAAAVAASTTGLRDSELKPLFRAVQTSWIRLLQNPFFEPDEHLVSTGGGAGAGAGGGTGGGSSVGGGGGGGGRGAGGGRGRKITSRKFGEDMRRIAEGWAPGVVGFEGF